MSTIAQKLEQLAEIKEDIRQAINDKGVEVTTAEPFGGYADKIAEIPQGGEREDAPLLDVNFYDYDGWRCYSYSKEDFLALTAMPEQPQNEGFIAQGWNWTLEQAQAHVRKYRYLEVGAYCATADGKTRLYVDIPEDNYTLPILAISSNYSHVTIDWGDGTVGKAINALRNPHTYAKAGNYVITLSADEGYTYGLGFGSPYSVVGRNEENVGINTILTKIEIGVECAEIMNYAFASNYRLKTINIPATVVGHPTYGWNSTFNNAYILKFVTVPQGLVSLSNMCNGCYSLKGIALPQSYSSIPQNSFASCRVCQHLAIPEGVTSIGNSAFSTLHSLLILTIPDTVTNIETSAFYINLSLLKIYIYATTPPTLGASNVFTSFAGTIYVPKGSLEAYQTATNWAAYASRMVEMEEEV